MDSSMKTYREIDENVLFSSWYQWMKSKLKYYLTPLRMVYIIQMENMLAGLWQDRNLLTISGNVTLSSFYENQYRDLQKKIVTSNSTSTYFLNTNILIWKSPMFILYFSTISSVKNQSKCPTTLLMDKEMMIYVIYLYISHTIKCCVATRN